MTKTLPQHTWARDLNRIDGLISRGKLERLDLQPASDSVSIQWRRFRDRTFKAQTHENMLMLLVYKVILFRG